AKRRARYNESAVLPVAVGPRITRSGFLRLLLSLLTVASFTSHGRRGGCVRSAAVCRAYQAPRPRGQYATSRRPRCGRSHRSTALPAAAAFAPCAGLTPLPAGP